MDGSFCYPTLFHYSNYDNDIESRIMANGDRIHFQNIQLKFNNGGGGGGNCNDEHFCQRFHSLCNSNGHQRQIFNRQLHQCSMLHQQAIDCHCISSATINYDVEEDDDDDELPKTQLMAPSGAGLEKEETKFESALLQPIFDETNEIETDLAFDLKNYLHYL